MQSTTRRSVLLSASTRYLVLATILIAGCGGGGGDDGAVEPASRSGSGSLSSSDRVTMDGSYFDDYGFRVNRRSTIRFEMNSTNLDAFIGILDDAETLYGWDDDSGPSTNALLVITLDPGAYKLRCTDYASGARSGSYTYSWETTNTSQPIPLRVEKPGTNAAAQSLSSK